MKKLGQAKRMRREPTISEARLWKVLRDRKLDQLKFRRQVPLGPYIVDFLCLERRLVVEADGPFHADGVDEDRDAWLRAQGFKILRIPNAQTGDLPYVAKLILAAVAPK